MKFGFLQKTLKIVECLGKTDLSKIFKTKLDLSVTDGDEVREFYISNFYSFNCQVCEDFKMNDECCERDRG